MLIMKKRTIRFRIKRKKRELRLLRGAIGGVLVTGWSVGSVVIEKIKIENKNIALLRKFL